MSDQISESIRNLSHNDFIKLLSMFVDSNFGEYDRKTHIDMKNALRFFQFGTLMPEGHRFFGEKGLRDIWNDAHFQRHIYLEAASRYHKHAGHKLIDVETT